ncbi:GNAT family N-acetyltransferase [Veronia pacifica]|uniref:N-acetyltransferase domain-containing protein n=1 Tax=Veronia pacifica TaxID=1080227 RepID=A0A1C3EAL0_9GAMM|nr:GNAT family N-acetyltransferase [Veronia pacifica]ODA30291.1 hypothetical protein A8L45_20390 [Veronia pacifica]
MPALFFGHGAVPPLNELVVSSNRLTLQPIHERFANDILTEFTAEITRYMLPKPVEDLDQVMDFIDGAKKAMCDGIDLVYAVCHKGSREFLGVCTFNGQKSATSPELGLWIKKSAHGNRYGREAMEILFHWAQNNIRFDYAIYPVSKVNIPSRQVAEALGGEVNDERVITSMSGCQLDEVIYHIPR